MAEFQDAPGNTPLGSIYLKPSIGGIEWTKAGGGDYTLTSSRALVFDNHAVVLAEPSVIFGMANVRLYNVSGSQHTGEIFVVASTGGADVNAAVSPIQIINIASGGGFWTPIPFQASLAAGTWLFNIVAREEPSSGNASISRSEAKAVGHSIGYVIFKS